MTIGLWLLVASFTLKRVGVEREVTLPNSHSKPYLRLSPHTAPDVDTPLSWEQGYDPLLCIALVN
ncbi:MAG: hypothetical protein P5694_23850, partial [Limnospira sp. PMC 1286.21]|nr:hypothetical protein [Limnospira sp. PMC 1286.21]